MSMVINTNVASLNAQRNLNSTSAAMQTALQRLSSGLRINSAKDDAAGLAISTRMSAQVKSLNQGIRNANDGISMIQTAESGLDQIQTMLQRMRELSVQASSDTMGSGERGYIKTEIDQLKTEIDNIAQRTKFNGLNLLSGSLSSSGGTTVDTAGDLYVGQAGADGDVAVTALDVSNANAAATFTFTYTAATNMLALSDGTVSQSIDLGAAIGGANLVKGATVTLDYDKLGVSITLAGTAASTVIDEVGDDVTTKTVKTAAGAGGSGSATFQVGADYDAYNQVAVSFDDASINSGAGLAALKAQIALWDNSDAATAGAMLVDIDTALDAISTQRAAYGAAQNRLTNAVASLAATSESLSAAKSQVTDADFAAETAALTRAQVLQQAGTAMLAQANAAPSQVLALLRNLG